MLFWKTSKMKKSFTRSPFRNKNDRVVEQQPSDSCLRDNRYIVNKTIWKNKIINFPLEINCQSGASVEIDNCEFNDLLIIRVGYDVSIEKIYIFCSEIIGAIKLYGSEHQGNEVTKNITIDSCASNKVEIIQLNCNKIEIYNTQTDEIILEVSKSKELVIDRSDVGILLEHGTNIASIDIHEKTFDNAKTIPKKLYSTLKKRYQNKHHAIDTSLRTIDFLLKNVNMTLNSRISSNLFYERNRIQIKSIFSRMILWLFGYFHSPARYLTTAMITYVFVCILLALSSVISGMCIPLEEVLLLSFNGLFGLSFTLSSSPYYSSGFVISFSIGVGTILYSGLLVTLINRYRIRF